MRNFTLIICFLSTLAVTATAQTNNSDGIVAKVSTDLSRIMAEELSLNEVDYQKFNNLVMERITQAAEASKQYSKDEAQLASRLKEIEEAYEVKVFKMLNSRQVAAYAQFHRKSEENFLSLVQRISGEEL